MVRLLTNFIFTSDNPKYRFLLEEDVTVATGLDLGCHTFFDANNVRRMSMCGTHWTVHAGYAWDGSSPKFRLAGRWVGTPDGHSELASLVHDTGYQFLDCKCFPLRRRQVDCLFGCIINRNGDRTLHAATYAGAVWIFGGIHRALGTILTRRKPCACMYHDDEPAGANDQ